MIFLLFALGLEFSITKVILSKIFWVLLACCWRFAQLICYILILVAVALHLQLRVVRAVAIVGGFLQIALFMCLCGIIASVCFNLPSNSSCIGNILFSIIQCIINFAYAAPCEFFCLALWKCIVFLFSWHNALKYIYAVIWMVSFLWFLFMAVMFWWIPLQTATTYYNASFVITISINMLGYERHFLCYNWLTQDRLLVQMALSNSWSKHGNSDCFRILDLLGKILAASFCICSSCQPLVISSLAFTIWRS